MTTIEGSSQLPHETRYPTNGVRCVFLGTNAILSGFLLTNGYGYFGGGVYCAATTTVVTNCILTGNSAGYGGGGVHGGTLYSCTLMGNSAHEGAGADLSRLFDCTLVGNSQWGANGTMFLESGGGAAAKCMLCRCVLKQNWAEECGGGAFLSTLYDCLLTGNSAEWTGGGAYVSALFNCTVTANNGGGVTGDSTLFNSIMYYNVDSNYNGGSVMNYCCTTPVPTNGVGNVTAPPLFIDLAAGDYRLREDSPCIDAGTNLDLPIIPNGWPTDTWPDRWKEVILEYSYEPSDILGNTRFIDGNGDGIVAWDIGAYEFNSWKAPRFAVHPQRNQDGWLLNITGAPNKLARLQRSGNLKDWEEIWSGWMGPEGVAQVNDGDTGQQVMFYRVVVQ